MSLIKNLHYLCREHFALLCNGSTADSGSVCQGSNPCGATNEYKYLIFRLLWANFLKKP